MDDSSPDGTADVARQLIGLYGDRIVLKSRSGKLGLGSAYIYAADFVDGDFVIILDADMSHHPKEIEPMIERQRDGDLDIVTGTRYALGGGVCGWDTFRKLTSRGANFIADFVLSPGVTDLTGSFRLYRRAVFGAIMSSMVARGYTFQMEVMIRARRMGYTIGEVPITFVDRLYGESKLGGGEIVEFGLGVIKLALTL